MSVAGAVLACVSVIFVSGQVSSWTIDLPEVRRFYFEKNSKQNDKRPVLNENQTYFDNIEGDSLYNTDRKHHEVIDYFKKYERNLYPKGEQLKQNDEPKKSIYAKAYNHDMYMVRKISQGALNSGPEYLDGLRLSIERYMEVLENCSKSNFTQDSAPSTIRLPAWREYQAACRQASAASEHVRRLADLALWATRRLQDVAHTAKYSKDASMEENELLLRLAWYLDKLAQLTGYEPQPEERIAREPNNFTTPRPTIPVPNPLNITEEMKLTILKCLNEKSDVPATERCAIPNAPSLMEQLAAMMSAGGTSQSTDAPINPSDGSDATPKVLKRSSDITPNVVLEPEILEATATDNTHLLPLTLTAVRSVKKRSLSDNDNPLIKIMKYYAKHTVWEYSNPKSENKDDASPESHSYDVGNHLTVKSIQKRSLYADKQTLHIDPIHKPLPPIHKPKPLLDVAHKIKVEAVKAVLDKIYGKHVIATHKVKHHGTIFRHKREISHAYTQPGDVLKPRVPENPQKNIGYYIKNKEGTDYDANVAQAALLRASLEAVFQRGNIEVVRRYGANYNPAVPAPFYAGIARSTADI